MKEWQLLSDRPMADRHSQFQHYLEWTKEKTGGNLVLRKSLTALIANNRVHSVVWGRDQLNSTNSVRKGIWTLEAAAAAVP
jgi:hypothetical protein